MAAFDITQLKSLEYDTVVSEYNSLVKIDDTHFIIAYGSSSGVIYIKTFSMDGNYELTEIDSMTPVTAYQSWCSLVKIDATHFMLAYDDYNDGGYIKTFSIDGSYDNITEIDSLEHDTKQGRNNSLVQIDATHYILAYRGLDEDGFIKTFSIDGSYNITEIDVLEHDTANGYYNSLVKIDATHFMLAYSSGVKTFSIDGSYNITQVNFFSSGFNWCSLAQLDATHYILAYRGTDADGFLKTFSINGSYVIAEIDSLEHDTSNAVYNSVVKIDATHFMLAYDSYYSYAEHGFVKTFSVDSSCDNITEIYKLNHNSTNESNYNSLVQIDATHYILAYRGTDADGFLKTFYVEAGVLDTSNFLQFF